MADRVECDHHQSVAIRGRASLLTTTVFVITYNYGRYLVGAVESALCQDVPVKVVIIDDGSTDDSRLVASRFHDRAQYLWKPNGGLADARNHGMDRCTTAYALFLDADDRLPPDYVRKLHSRLEDEPEAAFAYTRLAYFENREPNHGLTPDRVSSHAPYSAERLKRGNYIPSAALLRLSVIGSFRYDTRLRSGLEDWDFYLSIAERGSKAVYVDDVCLLCRSHADSMGAALQRRSFARRFAYLRIIAKHWQFIGPSEALGYARRWYRHRSSVLKARLVDLVSRWSLSSNHR